MLPNISNLPEFKLCSNRKIATPTMYDIKSWLIVDKAIDEYSKILEIYSLTSPNIHNNQKILLMQFDLLRKKNIIHRLFVCRTITIGQVIAPNPIYVYMESVKYPHVGISQRINDNEYSLVSGEIIKGRLYRLIDLLQDESCAYYAVPLHEDNLLDEIKTKKQTILPSLVQLCILSILTKDLPKYNELNQTVVLAIR